MPDLLLELRSEEIPARMQRRAAGDLKKRVTDALVDAGLVYEAAREYWTPRRLTLDLRGLSARSAEIREERKGPRTDAPQKAIEGFLRGAGLHSADQAEIRKDPKKGDFYVAVIEKPGRDAAEIIAAIMPAIIRDFPWPKSMRWGAQSAEPGALRWVRPLQSIVCTFGPETEEPEIVSFSVDGINSGDITFGHRFHAPEPIRVRRFDDYAASLERAKVILDGERRKQIILTDARNLAFANGLELIEDDALLEEVAGLVEWPVVLLGEFEERFLTIPSEVVRLTIKTNQKCFVARKQGDEDLSNRFVLVANMEASDSGRRIAFGNGLVVQARLSDAVHFWTTDRADLPDVSKLEESAARFDLDLNRPLDQRMARLDHLGVTFHGRLGTQGERVRRIAELASFLAPFVGADPNLARRAATLAKADLTTEIVGEFPEMQGIMGRKYAELQGEEAPVSQAIEEHYLPQGPSDRVPTEPVSIAVALSDKLDMLAGFWAIDEKPTGSKDPFALRRAALGMIRILLENRIRLRIGEAAKAASSNLAAIGHPDKTDADAVNSLLAFLHERLKVWLRDSGARHDLIDAVITPDSDDLLTIVRRVEALGAFLATDDGNNLLAGTKRASNILEAEAKKGADVDGTVDPALFSRGEEHALFSALEEAEKLSAEAISAEDYERAMGLMAHLRKPIDAFFDAVLVNADDPAIKTNRLALLARIRAATGKVADFSKIAG